MSSKHKVTGSNPVGGTETVMLISPTKKRLDELKQQLRELRFRGVDGSANPEVLEIEQEIVRLTERLREEQAGNDKALIKG